MAKSKKGCLHGIKIIDLTRVLAGPYCTMILGDMGAEIIKVEQVGRGDDSRFYPPFEKGFSAYFANLNRNKKSIELDLKKIEDKKILSDLIASADILVENFKPGVMDKLGFSYENMKVINPKIIFASISGFGQFGRYKDRPGYDIIAQAMGGFMSVTGWDDTPPTRTGTAIGDILGGLNATIGILAALIARESTGDGERIDISLVDCAVSAMETLLQIFLVEKRIPKPIGNRYEFIYPYDTFKTLDGWIVLAVGNDNVWKRFCEAMECPELYANNKYKNNVDRVKFHKELYKIVSDMMKDKNRDEIEEKLLQYDVPVCKIQNIEEIVNNPHIVEDRGMIVEIPHPIEGNMKVIGSPIKFTEHPNVINKPAPILNEHKEEILSSIGYYK